MNADRRVPIALGIVVLLAVATFGLLSWSHAAAGNPSPSAAPATASGSSPPSTEGGPRTPTPEPDFLVRVDSVEKCGTTCRDVTATLTNNQDRTATGVSVRTTIYAGDQAEGDPIWEGSEDVGTLAAGAADTETQRIELGFMDAAAVQQNDGHVTIEMVIHTDRQTKRFVQRRDVS